MTRAALTVYDCARAGLNLSAVTEATIALADGISFVNTGTEIIYFRNTAVGDVVATIQTGQTVDGLAVTDRTVTLQETGTAGDIQVVGPFPTKVYNQAAGGLVYVDVGTDAVLKIVVFKPTTS